MVMDPWWYFYVTECDEEVLKWLRYNFKNILETF